jgi:hypothetical protein
MDGGGQVMSRSALRIRATAGIGGSRRVPRGEAHDPTAPRGDLTKRLPEHSDGRVHRGIRWGLGHRLASAADDRVFADGRGTGRCRRTGRNDGDGAADRRAPLGDRRGAPGGCALKHGRSAGVARKPFVLGWATLTRDGSPSSDGSITFLVTACRTSQVGNWLDADRRPLAKHCVVEATLRAIATASSATRATRACSRRGGPSRCSGSSRPGPRGSSCPRW